MTSSHPAPTRSVQRNEITYNGMRDQSNGGRQDGRGGQPPDHRSSQASNHARLDSGMRWCHQHNPQEIRMPASVQKCFACSHDRCQHLCTILYFSDLPGGPSLDREIWKCCNHPREKTPLSARRCSFYGCTHSRCEGCKTEEISDPQAIASHQNSHSGQTSGPHAQGLNPYGSSYQGQIHSMPGTGYLAQSRSGYPAQPQNGYPAQPQIGYPAQPRH
jgi:hypothetical protein